MKKELPHFYVINFDINKKKFIPYDIIPYFIEAYKRKRKDKPKSFEEFKKFIENEGIYQFWGRCEYEIILVDWPCQKTEKKIDVWEQISMNIDTITNIIMEYINK